MKHQWNTGRRYTDKGQRIVAETTTKPPGIKFVDHDRMISGFIPLGQIPHGLDKYAMERIVMTAYDFTTYGYVPHEDVRHLQWIDPQ